jgi:hypothetical protein
MWSNHLPADVLEVDVDAVRGGRVELLAPARILVVDGGVEAEVLDGVAALLLGPRDPDDARAARLAELAGDRPDRARRGGDDHRFCRAAGGRDPRRPGRR